MSTSLTPLTLIRVFAICLVITVLTHPGLWTAAANKYSGDYIFNLSTLEIIGLIVITSTFVALLFYSCAASSFFMCQWVNGSWAAGSRVDGSWVGESLPRWGVVLICMAIALLLCAVGLLLVPQLHYLYYRLIIPDLPAQWVSLGDLSPDRLWQYFLLPANGTSTDHAKGTTVWICVLAGALVAFETTAKLRPHPKVAN